MKLFAAMKRFAFFCAFGLLAASLSAAEDSSHDKQLDDKFLDRLIGDWHVTRSFPNGRKAENTVHAQWTLNHQWIELQYHGPAGPQTYEADVFIGFDAAKKSYVCHWMDNFGGADSEMGWGAIDDKLLALEIKFGDDLTNRFTFDPETKTWTSLIRQVEHGDWKTFCEDKFVRLDARN